MINSIQPTKGETVEEKKNKEENNQKVQNNNQTPTNHCLGVTPTQKNLRLPLTQRCTEVSPQSGTQEIAASTLLNTTKTENKCHKGHR